MIIDSHQHFWKYNLNDYVWMEDWMTGLKADHEPERLEPLMREAGVNGTVAVQARQMVVETDYLLELTRTYRWIFGVVGWLDFSANDLEQNIARYADHEKLVGLRELIHDMDDPEYATSRIHTKAIRTIGKYDLAYDLLLRPAHIPAAIGLVDMFPDQRFVVDHIAKPNIAADEIQPWKALITELGRRPYVYCKLSGMASEADIESWNPQQLYPYIDVCLEAFGPERLMVGSDWPVCTLAGSYGKIMSVVLDYVRTLSESEQDRIFQATCREAYRLP